MANQLDILALEPYYGGVRREMLDNLVRCSRHRWTILKLPPRRLERRLSAAAHWFGEILLRHWVGRLDVLFTSEALNLTDLLRLVPGLEKKPSVVYFHDNELPDPSRPTSIRSPHDLANLSTAQSATELWFNSEFHISLFAYRAEAMVERHLELSNRNPVPQMLGKSRVMPPPVDLHVLQQLMAHEDAPVRRPRTLFIDTRSADLKLMNLGLSTLVQRGESFSVFVLGPTDKLTREIEPTILNDQDEKTILRAMLQSDVFLSTYREPPVDVTLVRAAAAGCWPVVPDEGAYSEFIPKEMKSRCTFDATPDALASRVQDLWHIYSRSRPDATFNNAVAVYDPLETCRAMDERLIELAGKDAGTG